MDRRSQRIFQHRVVGLPTKALITFMAAQQPQDLQGPRLWIFQLTVAMLYLLLGLAVHRYITTNGVVSILWPGSGLALAAMLIGGTRLIWGVVLGALVLNALSLDSLWAIFGLTLANALEAWAGVWLIHRFGRPGLLLESLRDYLLLITLGGLACVGAAALGVAFLWLAGMVAPTHFLDNVLTWWMGDALGIALVTPLILAWRPPRPMGLVGLRVLEILLLLGATFVAGQMVFLEWFDVAWVHNPRGYWMFLFVTLVAIRVGLRGATLAVAVVAVQALYGLLQGLGFFSSALVDADLSAYWTYMLTLSIVAVVVATNVKANREAVQALQLKERALDAAANGIVITDAKGSIEWSNQEFSRVTGYGRDEALGRNPRELVKSGRHDKAVYELLWRTILAKQVWRGEMVNRRKDGSVYDEEMTITPLLDEHGEVAHFVAVKQDISWRKRSEKYEQFRSRVLEHLAGDKVLPCILDSIVRGVEELHPNMLCSILLLDIEGKHLGQGVAPSLPDFYNAAIDGGAIGAGVGSCGTAAFTGERVIVEDIATHPYWADYKEVALKAGLRACWSEPIRSAMGRVLGTFAIYHREVQSPDPADIAIIEQSAHLASIAIERKRMEDAVRQLAFFDSLTGLPNRRLLSDRLAQAMAATKRHGRYGALMFLDLDNFKTVNDTHGHAVGDALLVEAAARMRNCVREMDTVARFAGDEFVVVLAELDTNKAVAATLAGAVAEKVRSSLAEHYLLTVMREGQADSVVQNMCSPSIGVVGFIDHLDTRDDIFKRADAAMYRAKKAGGNRVVFDGNPD